MNSDITLIIGTCDKYHMLWENFIILCNKFWQTDCLKLFISEERKVPFANYETHLPGKLPWSNRILSALDTIDTKYVLGYRTRVLNILTTYKQLNNRHKTMASPNKTHVFSCNLIFVASRQFFRYIL